MEKILVSACLFGKNTKYDGGNNYTPLIEELKKKYEIILACPESDGGLTTPRDPSEQKENFVFSNKGIDVTKEFSLGAEIALGLCKKHNIKIAILKDGSPSCGSSYIYDGTFSHTKITGMGVCAKLLKENGIKIYSEKNIEELL